MAKSATPKNKPAHEMRSGALKLTIWHNQSGKNEWYSVNLVRSYRVDDGWRETTQFNPENLLTAAKMLELAASWCNNHRKPT